MNPTAPSQREHDGIEYQRLCHFLNRAEVVPFLGAGASLQDVQGSESVISLPTGRQLASSLAAKLGLAVNELDADDLIEVASCFALYESPMYLEDELKKIFKRAGTPGPLHRFIAELTPPPHVIVTTNYDTLIEEAFREASRPFHLVMTPIYSTNDLMWWGPGESVAWTGPPADAYIQPSDIPIVYKIHGGLAPNGDWIRSVITEDDYFEVGGRIYESSLLPPQIAESLQDSSLLFLGYSLRDIHVRFLIAKSARWSRRTNFLINRRISRLDRMRFQRLRVAMIELPISDFLERLIAEMKRQGHEKAGQPKRPK